MLALISQNLAVRRALALACALLRSVETLRLTATENADGVLLIGYRHVVSRGDASSISQSQADLLLLADARRALAELAGYELSEEQAGALAALIFSAGLHAWMFSRVRVCLEQLRPYDVAETLSRWPSDRSRRSMELALWAS